MPRRVLWDPVWKSEGKLCNNDFYSSTLSLSHASIIMSSYDIRQCTRMHDSDWVPLKWGCSVRRLHCMPHPQWILHLQLRPVHLLSQAWQFVCSFIEPIEHDENILIFNICIASLFFITLAFKIMIIPSFNTWKAHSFLPFFMCMIKMMLLIMRMQIIITTKIIKLIIIFHHHDHH